MLKTIGESPDSMPQHHEDKRHEEDKKDVFFEST